MFVNTLFMSACACAAVMPGLQAANHLQPVIATRGAQLFGNAHRRVNSIGNANGKAESGRHDADDGVREAINVDGAPDDAGIAAEILLPDLVAQHRNAVTALLLFAGKERASQQRLHTENVEEVVGRRSIAQMEHLRTGVYVDPCVAAESGQRREAFVLLALVEITGPGRRLNIRSLPRVSPQTQSGQDHERAKAAARWSKSR
jgi:hypothetical protein